MVVCVVILVNWVFGIFEFGVLCMLWIIDVVGDFVLVMV